MPFETTLSRRRLLGSAAAGALVTAMPRLSGAVERPRPPNILFILADDLGYADLSCYGRRDYRTPSIDALAAQGLKLTHGYSNSSICSPTRCALATGRYQYRLPAGLHEPIPRNAGALGLPPGHPTLPSLLRSIGYRTALVGKWHLGTAAECSPLRHGYDHFFGIHGGAADYFTHEFAVPPTGRSDLYENDAPVERNGYLTDLLTAEAIREIERNATANQPFFLSLHYTAPHWPWEGPNDEVVSKLLQTIFHTDGGSLETYATMVRSLDDGVGRVLDVLARLQLERNTIVVFTSDNGGERFSDMWPFSGMKAELLEGGIRVPTLLRWPDRIAGGAINDQVIATMDWLPTLLAAVGGRVDARYPSDGENLLPTFLGQTAPRPRTIYWRFKANDQCAVREGNWKYLKIGANEFLFDVVADPRERANLAKRHPEMFQRLKTAYAAWDRTMLPYPADVYTYSQKDGGRIADRY
jgi:arylsulfatase A-like enzyme